MRSRLCLLAVVVSSQLLVACDDTSSGSAADAATDTIAAIEGGVEAPADIAVDAGVDAPVIDSAPDSAPDVVPVICLFDASLPLLEFPDAGAGSDGGDGDAGDGDGGSGDGGLGLAACLPCVATKCRASINACLDNCACRVGFAGFAECLAGGKMPLECAATLAQLPPGVAGLAQAPLFCAFAFCGKDCGLAGGI